MGFFKRIFSRGKKTKGGSVQSDDTHSSSRFRNKGHNPSPLDMMSDSDKALSRLLRSASAHFKVVSETDDNLLSPLPHPVNTVLSRSTSSLTTSNHANAQPRSSFSVTVHERQHHSSTEFPNAYPPLYKPPRTPHGKDDQKNTPDIFRSTKLADLSVTQRQYFNPRDVPFTPRDINRVRRLRQDPSVISLVNLYDADGRLDENLFANTPARPATAQGELLKRQSTFKELLGNHGASEADLLWAEQLIAENSPSTPSLSTVSLPLPTTPSGGSGKHCAVEHAEATFSSETSGNPRISSMIVELSVTTDDNTVPKKEDAVSKGVADSNARAPNGLHREPTHRASQVFKFISERRRRCQSLGSEEMLNKALAEAQPHEEIPAGPSKSEESDSKKPPPAGACPDLLTQPPSSFKPLSPALRGRSNSTGTTDIYRASASSEMLHEVDPMLVSYEEFKESHPSRENRRDRSGPHPSSGIPCTSTPVGNDKIVRSSSRETSNEVRPHGRALGDLTNANNLHTTHTKLKTQHEHASHAIRKKDVQPNAHHHASRHKARRHVYDCYEFEPDHDLNYGYGTKIERRPSELANKVITPRRTAVIVPYASNSLPLTPTHRRSLLESPSPVSSSELSPEAQQIMAALRARRAARMQRDIGKGSKRGRHAIRH